MKLKTLQQLSLCILMIFGLIISVSTISAQVFPSKNYTRGYFSYPVGAKIGLVANFGELRPNHYHMGLDCRTDKVQNKPVYAAADGYIAKVKIEPFGFGRAIYINHPNGMTTLYAHLNEFIPGLEKYVKEQQYKLQSWAVFIDIPANLFPVTKGQLIAHSGTTGGSQGPHTHFEIRETKTDKVLNPMLFGFPIPDNVPPTVTRLALYDRNISVYEQSPKLIVLKKEGGNLTTIPGILVVNTDRISFGICANDKFTGSTNPNGIFEADLFDNGKVVVGFQLDNITYDETRYENAHIDYKIRRAGGPFIEHLSRLPGYPQGIYKDVMGDGVIQLDDESIHDIRVEVKDAAGNKTILNFQVKRGVLKNDSKIKKGPAPSNEFLPGYMNIYTRDDVQVVLSPTDLYDSIRFVCTKKASVTPGAVSDVHSIHTALVPVHGYYQVRLKPTVELTSEMKDHIVMFRSWGGKSDVVKAVTERDNWFSGKFREFGDVQLITDMVPPVIVPVGIRENANLSRAAGISFVVKDNLKEIKSFTALLDGKWLRFTNDKALAFIYHFDEKCTAGTHELTVIAEDIAGNKTTKTFHFTR